MSDHVDRAANSRMPIAVASALDEIDSSIEFIDDRLIGFWIPPLCGGFILPAGYEHPIRLSQPERSRGGLIILVLRQVDLRPGLGDWDRNTECLCHPQVIACGQMLWTLLMMRVRR